MTLDWFLCLWGVCEAQVQDKALNSELSRLSIELPRLIVEVWESHELPCIVSTLPPTHTHTLYASIYTIGPSKCKFNSLLEVKGCPKTTGLGRSWYIYIYNIYIYILYSGSQTWLTLKELEGAMFETSDAEGRKVTDQWRCPCPLIAS